nr:hypothetical protein GCM10020185_35540 [Pseudomonas brassicacearum subsp. brassicacearum]
MVVLRLLGARRDQTPELNVARAFFDRTLGVGNVTAGDLAQQAAIDRAEAIEGFAGHRIGVLAVDEGAAFDLQVAGALFPVGTSQGGHACVLLLLSTNAARCAALKRILPNQPGFGAVFGIGHPPP